MKETSVTHSAGPPGVPVDVKAAAAPPASAAGALRLCSVSMPWTCDDPRAYRDQAMHLAGLAVIYVASLLLPNVSATYLYALMLPIGLVAVCGSLFLRLPAPRPIARCVVSLLDVAWVTVTMGVTYGLGPCLFPLLVALITLTGRRGYRTETIGLTSAAVGGLILLEMLGRSDLGVTTTIAQCALLVAVAVGTHITAAVKQERRASGPTLPAARDVLWEATADAVLNLEPGTLVITGCNPVAGALFADRGDAQSLVGIELGAAIRFDEPEFVANCLKRLEADGSVMSATTTATSRDGRVMALVVTLVPVASTEAAGCIQAVIHAHEETIEMPVASDAGAVHDFARHYVPSLAHELNNHLATIRLSADLAQATDVAPDLQAIHEELDHCERVLQTVVDQILHSVSPEEDGDEHPDCDLGLAMENVLLLAQPQILHHGIQMELDLPPGKLPRVIGQPQAIQEALMRIVLSLTTALSTQPHPRLLTWHVGLADGEVRVSLTHVGKGLNWRELTAVNGQADVAMRSEDRGWQPVREGLRRHGGALAAWNSVAGVTRFQVTLPIADDYKEGQLHEQAN